MRVQNPLPRLSYLHRHGGISRSLALGRSLGTVNSLDRTFRSVSPVVSGRDRSRESDLDHWEEPSIRRDLQSSIPWEVWDL